MREQRRQGATAATTGRCGGTTLAAVRLAVGLWRWCDGSSVAIWALGNHTRSAQGANSTHRVGVARMCSQALGHR
jgi:hypothetical protein